MINVALLTHNGSVRVSVQQKMKVFLFSFVKLGYY